MNESSSHINQDAARSDDQVTQYQAIAEAGVCPFCREHYGQFPHQDPPIHETEHWYTISNMQPYDYTSLHNVIVARRHVLSQRELTDPEWLDLKNNLDHFEKIKKLGYGAVLMRFGNPIETGASVGHLHAHLIVPDTEQVSYENVVRVRLSRKVPRP